MSPDISSLGLGFASIAIAFLIYLLVLGISLWIFYLIVRAAVTSGIMRASRKGAFQGMNAPQYLPPQGGQGHYPQ